MRHIARTVQVRVLLCVLSCVLTIALAVACRSNDTPTPSPTVPQQRSEEASADSAGEPDAQPEVAVTTNEEDVSPGIGSLPLVGTVVLWHSWSGNDADALGETLARTQIDHPDLTVETLFVAYGDLEQSYIEAVQAGGGPDLLLAPNWWLPNLVKSQSVAALNEWVSADQLGRYWPASVANLSSGENTFGIPVTIELVSLYYNRSLIAIENLPATTDEMLDLIRNDAAPGIGLYNSLYHLYWGIPAFGGQLLDANGKAVLDRGSGTADYLSWLIQLNESPQVFIDSDYGMLVDRFKKGEYAFFVDGPWSMHELRSALGDELQVALLPSGPVAAAGPWLTSEGFFINPSGPNANQHLAAGVALEMSDAESGLKFLEIAQRLPAARGVQSSDLLIRGFLQQAETAEAMPTRPEIYQALGYGGDLFVKVLNGVADPREAAIETAALINEANGR